MTSIIDIDTITDQEWYEVGRIAVEDVLIEFRDARIGILGRHNGLVVYEKDGTPSDIIRLTIEDSLKIGMRHIVNTRNKTNG